MRFYNRVNTRSKSDTWKALVIFPHWVGQIGWNLWKVDETIFTDPRLIMMVSFILLDSTHWYQPMTV